jgi:hypothetical protein
LKPNTMFWDEKTLSPPLGLGGAWEGLSAETPSPQFTQLGPDQKELAWLDLEWKKTKI